MLPFVYFFLYLYLSPMITIKRLLLTFIAFFNCCNLIISRYWIGLGMYSENTTTINKSLLIVCSFMLIFLDNFVMNACTELGRQGLMPSSLFCPRNRQLKIGYRKEIFPRQLPFIKNILPVMKNICTRLWYIVWSN